MMFWIPYRPGGEREEGRGRERGGDRNERGREGEREEIGGKGVKHAHVHVCMKSIIRTIH